MRRQREAPLAEGRFLIAKPQQAGCDRLALCQGQDPVFSLASDPGKHSDHRPRLSDRLLHQRNLAGKDGIALDFEAHRHGEDFIGPKAQRFCQFQQARLMRTDGRLALSECANAFGEFTGFTTFVRRKKLGQGLPRDGRETVGGCAGGHVGHCTASIAASEKWKCTTRPSHGTQPGSTSRARRRRAMSALASGYRTSSVASSRMIQPFRPARS